MRNGPALGRKELAYRAAGNFFVEHKVIDSALQVVTSYNFAILCSLVRQLC